MNLVGEFISYEQRQQIISDIKKYYHGGNRWQMIIGNMPDSQLLAFRQSITNTGKLNGNMNREIGIHINVIMNIYNANEYIIDVVGNTEYKDEDTYKIYIGRDMYKKDKFGNPINIQYGFIEIDKDYKIIKMDMLGKKHKRYNGMKLNFSWNTIE